MGQIGVVVLLGPPGSGKGTQARNLSLKHSGWIHISTGDLFRAEISSGSPLGLAVKDVLATGKLVSDEVTNQVFESQTNKIIGNGSTKVLLVDGFPRTQQQTKFLQSYVMTHSTLGSLLFVEFKISEGTVISRVADRLVNPRNGRVYHRVTNPPMVAGIDDEDGGPLIQRADDNPETIKSRFKLYSSQLGGILAVIPPGIPVKQLDAEASPEAVGVRFEELISASLKSNK